jgi:hypothetical protein
MVISATLKKWTGRGAVCLLSPIWFPGMAILFAMLWVGEWYDRTFGPKVGEWQPWFAWRPTELGTWDGETVWLERVERTRIGHADIYRRPGDLTVPDPWASAGRAALAERGGAE